MHATTYIFQTLFQHEVFRVARMYNIDENRQTANFTPGKQPYFEISDDHPLNTVGERPRSLMNFRLR
jgi:hypothetical protein